MRKKKLWKRILALGLCITLTAGLPGETYGARNVSTEVAQDETESTENTGNVEVSENTSGTVEKEKKKVETETVVTEVQETESETETEKTKDTEKKEEIKQSETTEIKKETETTGTTEILQTEKTEKPEETEETEESFNAKSDSDQEYGDFKYTVNGDNVTITGYTGAGGSVVVPQEIDGKTVTAIGDYAFDGCSSLTSLSLPESLTSVGYCMICGTGITSITIPKNVSSSGSDNSDNGALSGCTVLKEVIFEEGMKCIPAYIMASDDYTSYVEKVVIPSTVTEIGYKAFYNCKNMTIYGYANSYAESYAKENDIPFVSVAISKNATAEEVLSHINLNTLIGDLSLSGTKIEGPSVTVSKKTFDLFSVDASVDLKLSDKVQAKVDTEKKTIQVLVGFDKFSGSADISSDKNSNAYWSESYKEVKSLYTGVTGKKVDTTQLWNRYSKLRGRLKKMNCSMGLSADATVAGYMEFSYASGEVVYSEGGIILEAGLGAQMEYRFPPCSAIYMTFGANADFKGNIKLVREDVMSYQMSMSSAIDLSAKLGAGVGSKKIKTYAEGGFIGTLGIGLELPADSLENALTAKLSASVYFESKVIGFNGPSYGPEEFTSYQIYPQDTRMQLFKGQDLAEFDLSDAVLSDRSYLSEETITKGSLVNENVSFEKDNPYPYCTPQLVSFNDGTKLLVWVDDDGTKSGVNKTSLMYAYYDGTDWSDEKILDENGGVNDYPSVYSDGNKAYILWQRAPEMPDDTSLEELLEKVDLYEAVWENGKMSRAEQITSKNTVYEMMNTVTSDGDKVAVAWIENSQNDPFQNEGTECIKVKEYADGVWKEKTVSSGLSGVGGLAVSYVGDQLVAAYENTDENAKITLLTDIDEKIIDGYGMYVEKDSLYYNTEKGLQEYDLATGAVSRLGLDAIGDYTVIDNGVKKVIVTTGYEGFTSELLAYTLDNTTGIWSDPVTLTNDAKYIRSYSADLDSDGKFTAVCNFVDVDEQSDTIYGNAAMVVSEYAEQENLTIGDAVYYDLDTVAPGAVLPLHFYVTNNGLDTVKSFDVILTDENGEKLQKGKAVNTIAPGETSEITFNYNLPDILTYHTVQLNVLGKNEVKTEDNIISVKIGYADISVENIYLSGNSKTAKLAGSVKNIGYADAENIRVQVYDGSAEGTLIGTAELGTVEGQKEALVEIQLPDEYTNVNPLASGNALYVTAESDSEEMRLDNNSTLYLVKSETDAPMRLNYEKLALKKGNTEQISVTYSDTETENVEWSSSNDQIVSVDAGKVTAVSQGTAVITAQAGGQTASCEVTVSDTVAVTDIYLEETGISVLEGNTKQLTAYVLPETAQNQNVIWESSDVSVATVTRTGIVKGVSVGKTVITAISEDGNKTASCNVTVSAKENQQYTVGFSGGEGSSGTRPVVINGTAGTIVTLPQNTYKKQGMVFVGWSDGTDIYDEGVLYRIPYHNVTFVAQWSKDGQQDFIISASSQVGGTITPSGDITVAEGSTQSFAIAAAEGYEIADVKVDGESIGAVDSYEFKNVTDNHSIEALFSKKSGDVVNKKQQILTGTTAYQKKVKDQIFDLDAKIAEGDGTLSYTSSNTSVVRVDNTGTVMIFGTGKAVITVMASETEEYSAARMEVNITVSENDTETPDNTANTKLKAIRLDADALILKKGKSRTLTAKLEPAGVQNVSLVWTSSAPDVIAVDNRGRLTAKANGQAVITVAVQGKETMKAHCQVTVPYNIIYKLNKGTNDSKNPNSYYNQKITLKNPKRKGYSFRGWYADKKYKNKVSTIKKGTKKDFTLYAKWQKIKVAKVNLTSVKNNKAGQVQVKYKKVSGVKGYEISYSKDAKFKKQVIKKTTKQTSYTVKKLKKKKTYYVRIRAYSVDSTGKKVYGKYSVVKKVKIAK